MVDLSTTYLGLQLAHPIVPSAGPLTSRLDRIKRLEDAGAPAVVLVSLFEEQIEHESLLLDHYLSYGAETYAEALSYFPDLGSYNLGPEEYLKLIQRAKAETSIPIIASLNGVSSGGWTEYARQIEQAGADALELNIYYVAADIHVTGAEVEQRYIDVLKQVRQVVSIPLAVKVGPFFSAMANMAKRLVEAGANGLVLFNRFYQPDFDIEALEVVPHLVLSTSDELRLPLRWIAILYGRVKAALALSTGVHTHEDVIKGIMAGASVTMLTSELLRHGPGRISQLVRDLSEWMEQHEYGAVAQMRGCLSQRSVANPDAFERANYAKVLQSWRAEPSALAPKS
ncbi:MAG: dihydroorotate dehydrogenase-like protein [Anaerolineae bacterium]|nr:dihydroorotate dehydrogenase-like protein [Anaerolineae bacterium]MDW8292197.1 dihydroorotate dehydrogenase-like protein [Anaerolineae bacterium]